MGHSLRRAVLVSISDTCRLIKYTMNGFTKILLLASVAAVASAMDEQGRKSKSLLSVFPFNNGQKAAAAHEHHHDHHDEPHHQPHHLAPPAQDFSARSQRQQDAPAEEVALDIGSIAQAGERCVEKVVMEQHTVYDDHITCKHSYDEKCHTTYTTDYEPQQEEVCEETFTKSCFIEYKKVASEEPIKFCYTPLSCEGDGPDEEKTVYESECTTHYHKHPVEDDVVSCQTVMDQKCEDVTQGYTTAQECHSWPRQECTTSKVAVEKVTENVQCQKKPRTITVKETCNLEPQKSCRFVAKLVPLLKPAEECVDIPKEVCSRTRIPRAEKELKPVIKKWCYVATEESGLA